ncbi:DUF4381 domain-containing protein [Pseudomonas sp. MS19]|uniref:DUF4381 domain-containing protein n=1 Tax=Pseudomonas sp. MS19 TaxID=2579939 RepID=UPI0015628533|nr:DUF4381 domain-containing protein [Pseudomonas sp. MS19]NRH28361.1 DUF4381 domain-containing protein [Pseudomonas sp. MS19]
MTAATTPTVSQLKELPLAQPPFSYFPQTWGWVALLIIVLLALIVWGWLRWRQWKRDRYRREALAQLSQIELALTQEHRRLQALRQVPVLLKRVALSIPGSPAVASLGGDQWQAFLQRSSTTTVPSDFSHQLGLLAYGTGEQVLALAGEETDALLTRCRQWIEDHHVAA